jgi:hypothetical protein
VNDRYLPNKWISVEGILEPDEFRERASQLRAKLGGSYNLRRYFCDDGELFHSAGRTYALSNQWGLSTLPVVDEIISLVPPGAITYTKMIGEA